MDEMNSEFIRLLSGSGWNQSRAARELHLDTGTISRYVAGETRPSMTVLKLFSELIREPLHLRREHYTPSFREDARASDPAEVDLLIALRRLPVGLRQRFILQIAQLAAMVANSFQGPGEKIRDSVKPTKPESVERKNVDDDMADYLGRHGAAMMAAAGIPIPPPTPIAALPIESKPSLPVGAGKAKGVPRSPQGVAQAARAKRQDAA